MRQLLALFMITWGTLVPTTHAAPAKHLCTPPAKAQLAMDQRDRHRLECLKKNKARITVNDCLRVAKEMEYSNNAEGARMVCLYDLKRELTLDACLKVTKAMEYADSGDESRWECIRRFSRKITPKQCMDFANDMDYPANQQRALVFCESELL